MIHASLIFISSLVSIFKLRRNLALENLAIRRRLALYQRRHPRPQLRPRDRLFWVWSQWRSALLIVKPETAIRRHRDGFKFFWTGLSRRKRAWRPSVNAQISSLIRLLIAPAHDR